MKLAGSLGMMLLAAVASLGACSDSNGSDAAGGGAGAAGSPATGGQGGAPAAGGGSGATGSGGSTAGGGNGGSSPDAGSDPTEIAVVAGWLTNTNSGLESWAYSNIKKNFPTAAEFDSLVGAIVKSCAAFAPSAANWQRYCEAVITSAIVSESSYNPISLVNSPANDPTVGLLQVRFSSTVQDYNLYGRLDAMAAIGCAWPAALQSQTGGGSFWTTAGATTYLGFMQDVACNIGLATWYYFINATGNGGSSAVYAGPYCQGKGVGATMVVGLLSHLMGPAGAHPPDPNNSYVTGIKGRFTKLVGGLPSPDPFGAALSPEPAKFCR